MIPDWGKKKRLPKCAKVLEVAAVAKTMVVCLEKSEFVMISKRHNLCLSGNFRHFSTL